jgi:predicted lipoprotein
MKQRKLVLAALLGCIGTGVFISCSKSNDDNGGGGSNTKNDSVLVNIGNEVILPAYQQLATTTATMDAAVIAFNAAPDAATLTSLQTAFKAAYVAYESCTQFEFGPAVDQSMVTTIVNVFPTDTNTINSNITNGTFTIDGIGNFKAQGFPAIDFMLYSGNVLANFTGSRAANEKKYLAAVSGSLKAKSAAVLNAWSASGGKYIDKFVSTTGVDAGSSLSLLVNAFVYDYDVILKNFKLGIPVGKYGPTTLPKAPEKVEAYYSGISLQLLEAQLDAVQRLYLAGLDDKMIAANAQTINTNITTKLITIISKVKAITGPLSTAIKNNDTAVDDAFTDVQQLVVLIKVDMSSSLGVKISFQDDDGD